MINTKQAKNRANTTVNFMVQAGLLSLFILLSACSTTPPISPTQNSHYKDDPNNPALLALVDHHHYLQTDPKWASQTLGGSGEPLRAAGCLVTAAAMALSNLGFQTNPGDLNKRLKSNGGFTKNGYLIWKGLEKATGGKAKTIFYQQTEDEIVRQCLRAGYYPLVKFKLPSRRSHWAVIVKETKRGFYVRDPMVAATIPIPLLSRADGIDAVRCVGVPT